MKQLASLLPGWDEAVSNLKTKAAEFQRNYNLMVSVEPYTRKDPALYNEFVNTKKAADMAKSAVSTVTGLIDSGYRWFTGSGLNGANMGVILPLVPAVGVAAVVSAAAALSYLIPKMYEIYIKGALVRDGKMQSDIAFPGGSASIGDGLKSIADAVPWIIGGIGVYLLLPYLKGKK